MRTSTRDACHRHGGHTQLIAGARKEGGKSAAHFQIF
jgi:hypothetical protein